MPDSTLPAELDKICVSLETLANGIESGWNREDTLESNWGWNHPHANRHELSRLARDLAKAIRERGTGSIDPEVLTRLKDASSRIDRFKTATVQYFYNGNSPQAVGSYLVLLEILRNDLEPVLGWQRIQDANLLPPRLARRLKSYSAQLDALTPNKEKLEKDIKLIADATAAAESLPTDLEALSDARSKVKDLAAEAELLKGTISKALEDVQGEAAVTKDKMSGFTSSAEDALTRISEAEKQTAKLVEQCEDAYRITTTKGLAGAFEKRSFSLQVSMWIWVGVLVAALGTGYMLGSDRIKTIADVISKSQHSSLIWFNGLLALFSFGGPIWLAWIATKQIGQCFRLKEDYAFKASVAKAYEGYRKEAARIDEELEARLFSSALSRLEEAPLRLVEEKTPGSPWHELLESNGFRKAFDAIPELRADMAKITNREPAVLDHATKESPRLREPKSEV